MVNGCNVRVFLSSQLNGLGMLACSMHGCVRVSVYGHVCGRRTSREIRKEREFI